MSETFGQRLARLRAAAGLSQPALAEAAGVPLQTLRNWERGRREPSAGGVRRLVLGLGCDPADLLGLGGEKSPCPT